MKKLKVVSILITIGLMTLIFFFSSQNSDESNVVSGGITYRISLFLTSFLDLSVGKRAALCEDLEFYVRKAAHFSIYAALGCSSAISIKLLTEKKLKKCGIVALVFCFLYAASDEFHQMFVSGRSAQLRDVFIDTTGAVFGILFAFAVILLFKRIKKKKKRDKNDN